MRRLISSVVLLSIAATSLVLGGCGAYTLQGHVVSGQYNMLEFVPSSDPRLREPGMAGVRVEAIRNPDSLGKEVVAGATSGRNGEVRLVINEFGAGWMDEAWDLRARIGSNWFAESRTQLPRASDDLRLLIVISPGTGSSRGSMDEEQTRRLGESGISIPDSSIYRR
jgi:hypothetical protein